MSGGALPRHGVPEGVPEQRQFADTLRAAIEARGLGLERLQAHLRTHGITISLATLSYWQSGRSRPERRSSLAAISHLEALLEVPAGSLAALLGPPRPRGRWLNSVTESPTFGAFWPRPSEVEQAVSQVDTHWDDRLTRISQHDRVTVGPDRGERSFASRQVLRADADGPDRWVVVVHLDEHDRALPIVEAVRNCRLGKVVDEPASGLLVAELLFPAALRRGETIIIEHELVNRAPYPLATNYERKFRLPAREFVLEVCFDPAALPVRCEQVIRHDGGEQVKAVSLDETHSVHGVALDFAPGCYGFRWSWES
ncbi:hypothetical protein EV193_11126 [Herbihabitans rhizosphaerae]|uniref:Uncharacterized protein n=1 Tax=Herbihabitans rhizosphaerae TaxID=1872711 RepID=A0A4Q7KFB4_9PSEU|nr:XRE family transcriptional regulator [Herbihabitans rhizosphaerae]RZS32650.1 hypothetical protein EV193_11126 [Herbihabitans rhizosphaerae]